MEIGPSLSLTQITKKKDWVGMKGQGSDRSEMVAAQVPAGSEEASLVPCA